MSENNTEASSIKTYFLNNAPPLIFHLFLSIFAMIIVLFTYRLQLVFFSIAALYVLFGLALKNQGTFLKNLLSVSLVFLFSLLMFTIVAIIVPGALMFYSLPYLYLALIQEPFIYFAILLPSVWMLIGLYGKILIVHLRK